MKRKSEVFILFFIILIITGMCEKSSKTHTKKLYLSNNKNGIIKKIDDLHNEEKFAVFLDKLYQVQNEIEFVYGYLDITYRWDTVDVSVKEHLKSNLIETTKLYVESDVFKCKSHEFNDLLFIQDEFYSREKMTDSIKALIVERLNSFKCK